MFFRYKITIHSQEDIWQLKKSSPNFFNFFLTVAGKILFTQVFAIF